MLKNKEYANGQKTYELIENKMTYFFYNDKIKAEGLLENNHMQG